MGGPDLRPAPGSPLAIARRLAQFPIWASNWWDTSREIRSKRGPDERSYVRVLVVPIPVNRSLLGGDVQTDEF